jgi:DNA polymerase I-like protein with 3'-5' exonuclease and polymerase domains
MSEYLKIAELNPPLNVSFVNCLEDTHFLLDFLEEQAIKADKTTGFDIETDPKKDFYYRRCRTIQFGRIDKQVVVDLLGLCDNDPELLFAAQGEYGKNLHKAPKLKAFIEQISPYITGNLLLCGVNLGFEFMVMYWSFGVQPWKFFDTSVVERCIYAGTHSLKDYGFFSMNDMVDRYFSFQINKELQTSFTLDKELTQDQIDYAALDTRLPLAIKKVQEVIIKGETKKTLKEKGQTGFLKVIEKLDQNILGDNLEEISRIENDAIAPFISMHIHGERLDTVKWLERVNKNKDELKSVISQLDAYFLPVVGSKNESIDESEIEKYEGMWQTLRSPTDHEIELKLELSSVNREVKKALKGNNLFDSVDLNKKADQLQAEYKQWETARKQEKDLYKKKASELRKKKKSIVDLVEKCDGEALINYSSNFQLIKVLKGMYKQLSKLEDLEDETLEKFKHLNVIALIQKYHELAKLIGTYGESWASVWKTHPCKEEGWLNPGDQRLHSIFSQMDAETGRSTSSQPNGQNLPQDKAIRSCFVADPPDEKYPDGYKLITIDMAGAELRLLAEEANDPIWITAFNKNEDVHSVCTELIEGDHWKELALPDCAYYKLRDNGEPQHFKCKCDAHNSLRNSMKPTNFGLPYGIGPRSLSKQIGKTYQETILLMEKHRKCFPNIWDYLAKSGESSKILRKSFDMFGRRRTFPEPTWDVAKQRFKEDEADKLALKPEECKKNLDTFLAMKGRKPTKDELFSLTHREPTSQEVSKKFAMMYGGIERQGKNHAIQGANASVIKICMGSGFDKQGKPFLFHILPKYDGKLLKMVHDELLIQVPAIYADELALIVQDCIRRAAAMRMTKIVMESEYHISDYWEK